MEAEMEALYCKVIDPTVFLTREEMRKLRQCGIDTYHITDARDNICLAQANQRAVGTVTWQYTEELNSWEDKELLYKNFIRVPLGLKEVTA